MISYDFFEVNEGDELFELEKLNFGISIPDYIVSRFFKISRKYVWFFEICISLHHITIDV